MGTYPRDVIRASAIEPAAKAVQPITLKRVLREMQAEKAKKEKRG